MSKNYCLTLDECEIEDTRMVQPNNDIIDTQDDSISLLARSILQNNEEDEICQKQMIAILKHWQEKITNNTDNISRFSVNNKEDLRKIIRCAVSVNSNANLNWIDVSNIRDMSFLFWQSSFNGDISEWNVSNVENMFEMFYASNFNGDISNWDVSNVMNMKWMFLKSKFTRNICDWTISNETKTDGMFMDCPIASTNKPKVLQLQK